MNTCPNCLAQNSFKKYIQDGHSLTVCEYCNSVVEKIPILSEDIVDEDFPSPRIFESSLDRPPVYDEKNIATFNTLIKITLLIGLIIFVSVIIYNVFTFSNYLKFP
ncbi:MULTISPECIES: hypothetical protein [Lysinibacillus]|uniref:hypothetical protein n=1 Tax=Lysinibacillus TaxID=400634 RepID=UPI00257AE5A6|nr:MULTISPECIES: hypothetical protein [Lysinibacillus]